MAMAWLMSLATIRTAPAGRPETTVKGETGGRKRTHTHIKMQILQPTKMHPRREREREYLDVEVHW